MLDRDLKNALHGLTVIEEDVGSVSRILARQLGAYAKAAGRRVVVLSLTVQEPQEVESESEQLEEGATTIDRGSRGIGVGRGLFGAGLMTVLLAGASYDMMIVEGFSSFLFDKTDREVADAIRQMTRLVDQGKSFILTFDRNLVGEKTAAYIRAAADSVIEVRTELVGTRIDRMLYVRKMRDSTPLDRMIKITVDEAGVQVDTREFVG
jgi:KaiC/GvpD/RAD55 family RecA-like ATPase